MTAATCTFVPFPLFLQQNICVYATFENPWNHETINVHLQLGWISFHIENATKMMKIPNMDINPQIHIFVSLQRRTVLNIKSVSPIAKKSLPRGSETWYWSCLIGTRYCAAMFMSEFTQSQCQQLLAGSRSMPDLLLAALSFPWQGWRATPFTYLSVCPDAVST